MKALFQDDERLIRVHYSTDKKFRFAFTVTHFKPKEMQCKDGSEEMLISSELMLLLEEIREHFNAPVKINSGYRTPSWNEKVGGAKNSYHCKGMAADIIVKGQNTKEVAKYASEILGDRGGVIRYANFVHVDVRAKKYRKGV